MIGNLCCLVVGAMLGGLLCYRFAIMILDRPNLLGRFLGGALRGLAMKCRQDALHFVDCEGAAVCIPVHQVAHTLEVEIEAWRRLDSEARGAWPDGYA